MGTSITSSPATAAGVSAFRPLPGPLNGKKGFHAAARLSAHLQRPAYPPKPPSPEGTAGPNRNTPVHVAKRVAFVLGGARSGKSRHALTLAEGLEGPKVFVATAQALDTEMAERIRRHRQERGRDWRTVEEPLHLEAALGAEVGRAGVVVIDCLTLWLANLLGRVPSPDDAAIEAAVGEAGRILAGRSYHAIVVSNELGLGIVPADPSVRRYRNLLGVVNQRFAGLADRVVLMVAGCPITVREGGVDARS